MNLTTEDWETIWGIFNEELDNDEQKCSECGRIKRHLYDEWEDQRDLIQRIVDHVLEAKSD